MARVNEPFFTCVCGKRGYHSRKAAKTQARRHHPGDRISAYQCDESEVPAWHLGHLPLPVLAGKMDRGNYRRLVRRARQRRPANVA